jgi:hypothetical protein
MWQFRFNFSCELNWRTGSSAQAQMKWKGWPAHFIWIGKVGQFISFERERLTSSFHLNRKGWPVHFVWTGDEINWSKLQLDEINLSKSRVEMNWTGQPFPYKWNELVNLSRSNERELFEQFQFNELKWNCHIPKSESGQKNSNMVPTSLTLRLSYLIQ